MTGQREAAITVEVPLEVGPLEEIAPHPSLDNRPLDGVLCRGRPEGDPDRTQREVATEQQVLHRERGVLDRDRQAEPAAPSLEEGRDVPVAGRIAVGLDDRPSQANRSDPWFPRGKLGQ